MCVGGGVGITIIGKNDSLCNINHDRFQEKTVVVLPTALAVHTGGGLIAGVC